MHASFIKVTYLVYTACLLKPVIFPPRGVFPISLSVSGADRVYCHTSEDMRHIPDESVALAFTSPPYNSGKDYDENLNIADYFKLMCRWVLRFTESLNREAGM